MIDSHASLLVAVHAQPAPAVTVVETEVASASTAWLTVLGAEDFKPARFSSGPVPLPLRQIVGWAEVFLL